MRMFSKNLPIALYCFLFQYLFYKLSEFHLLFAAKVSALPKIVLQSFLTPDTVKPSKDAVTIQPTSIQSSCAKPSVDEEAKTEISNTTETSQVPGITSVVSEKQLHNGAQSEFNLTSASNNVRKRKAEEPVRKDASFSNNAVDPRQLRLRSQVVTRMTTRSTQKRKKDF